MRARYLVWCLLLGACGRTPAAFPRLSAEAACPANGDGDWELPEDDPSAPFFEAYAAWEEAGVHGLALTRLDAVLNDPYASACAKQLALGYRVRLLIRLGRLGEARSGATRILRDGPAHPFRDDALFWIRSSAPR